MKEAKKKREAAARSKTRSRAPLAKGAGCATGHSEVSAGKTEDDDNPCLDQSKKKEGRDGERSMPKHAAGGSLTYLVISVFVDCVIWPHLCSDVRYTEYSTALVTFLPRILAFSRPAWSRPCNGVAIKRSYQSLVCKSLKLEDYLPINNACFELNHHSIMIVHTKENA